MDLGIPHGADPRSRLGSGTGLPGRGSRQDGEHPENHDLGAGRELMTVRGRQVPVSPGRARGAAARRNASWDEEGHRRPPEAGRELRSAQQIQADFLVKLSHDLRTPLTSVREFVSILRDGLAGTLTDIQREYLGIALRNADTLAEMIEHLLVLTRIQQGNLRVVCRRVSLSDLLGDRDLLIGARPKGKSVDLHVEIPGTVPDVFADPDRLLEAVRNLVDNAVKYSGDTVNVTIAASAGAESTIDLRIHDDGRGMDPATLRGLFRRFYRGTRADRYSPGGLGLGLSIVKEIVERHGGTVNVWSKLGEGTEFRLSLPRYEPKSILIASLRNAWRTSADGGPGFGYVRAGVRRCRGVVCPSRRDAMLLIREALRRALRPEDLLLPDSETDKAVYFLLTGDRVSMDASIRKLQRTVADRLGFRSAIELEWDPDPTWLHSRDFNNPEQMAVAILHRRSGTGELLDVAQKSVRS
jgi:signal transduction histidine kinase